jgi:hypothetical protein
MPKPANRFLFIQGHPRVRAREIRPGDRRRTRPVTLSGHHRCFDEAERRAHRAAAGAISAVQPDLGPNRSPQRSVVVPPYRGEALVKDRSRLLVLSSMPAFDRATGDLTVVIETPRAALTNTITTQAVPPSDPSGCSRKASTFPTISVSCPRP